MKVISWSKSDCKDGWLHIFEIVGQDSGASIEICKICGDLQVFPIVNGKPDNQTYLSYHLHSALPPWHPLHDRQYKLFKQINGNK